ncbi:MAG TPA: CBS domain-containing protein [Kineosporiaceae bacterium]|nr:CBS domain-containing protein [Kineosporiaceae bacterium]
MTSSPAAPGPTAGRPGPLCLSGLLGRPAVAATGEALGKVVDVVVRLRGQDYPQVTGLVTDLSGRRVFLPAVGVADWQPDRLVLTSPRLDVRPFDRRAGEVLLRADVLGHRLVDIAHARLVRAYDLQLTPSPAGWTVTGLDVRHRRWRRACRGGAPAAGAAFADWKAFEALIGHQSTVPVRAPFGRLRRLRPAELADLLEDASRGEQAEILAHVHADPELEADVFEELDDHRPELLAGRTDAQIADVLAHMRTDDAADTLAELPQRRRAGVLARLPEAQRAAVRDLLAYNETTAGGLMGLEYLALPAELTAEQALSMIRSATAAPVEAAATVHLLTGSQQLAGTVPLLRLLQADPGAPLPLLADPDPVRVTPDTDLASVAVLMADHNLPTLPVVDAADRLLGVITVDDVLDNTVPDGWRDREPPPRPTRPETTR